MRPCLERPLQVSVTCSSANSSRPGGGEGSPLPTLGMWTRPLLMSSSPPCAYANIPFTGPLSGTRWKRPCFPLGPTAANPAPCHKRQTQPSREMVSKRKSDGVDPALRSPDGPQSRRVTAKAPALPCGALGGPSLLIPLGPPGSSSNAQASSFRLRAIVCAVPSAWNAGPCTHLA